LLKSRQSFLIILYFSPVKFYYFVGKGISTSKYKCGLWATSVLWSFATAGGGDRHTHCFQ